MKTNTNPIKGFPNYALTEDGHLFNVNTRCQVLGWTRKSGEGRKPYRIVELWHNNESTRFRMGRLMMATFVGPPPAGHIVNHIDEDTLNDALSNLEYITGRANMLHSLSKRSTSNFAGVSMHKDSMKWRASINIDGKTTHLGIFEKSPSGEIIAAQTYWDAHISMLGDAPTNSINPYDQDAALRAIRQREMRMPFYG